jgi:hypothetical protein
VPYCVLQKGWGGGDFGSLQKIWSNNAFFFVCYGQYQWWAARFVPVVIVVDRGDATGVLGLFQI